MIQNRSLAVIVPAHNEARWIATVLLTMPEFVDHVFVVDDASEDGTAGLAQRVGDPRVVVLGMTGIGAWVLRL